MLVHIVIAIMAMGFICLILGIWKHSPMFTMLAAMFWVLSSVTTYSIDFPVYVNSSTSSITVEAWHGNPQLLFYGLAIISIVLTFGLLLDLDFWKK